MSVAVVILTYNSRAHIAACLACLRRLTTPVEIIVADNASADGTAEYVREIAADVRVMALGRNWGFAEGYNRALAQVEAEWIALLNPDACLAPDWLAILLQAAAAHPRAAILGGKLLFSRGDTHERILQCAGTRVTDAGTAFEVGWGQPDRGQYDEPCPTASVPGAAMLIRRAVFHALGGFDPAYFTYLEDVDLCWRAWLAGHEVWYVPQAEAFHHFGAASGGRASPFRIRWMQRNRLANMIKHLEPGTLLSGALTSTAYDLYRVLEFTGRGQWAGLQALASGTLDFWRGLPALLAERRRLQGTRRLSDRDLRQQGLLVPAWEAFREYRRLSELDAR